MNHEGAKDAKGWQVKRKGTQGGSVGVAEVDLVSQVALNRVAVGIIVGGVGEVPTAGDDLTQDLSRTRHAAPLHGYEDVVAVATKSHGQGVVYID